MNQKELTANQIRKEYIKFIKARLANSDFRAEEKIKRIDEIAEIVFTAKNNFNSEK